ncbi:hypothetical protein P175DRAFT_0464987 [Aspergillus ochraceoroseus IBT 24754]|uniref:Uncharacterized protein n=1 Tax=Aspergillus ochraceoroseus IBT 24754 TaxID=1392256 RepID=A0A2T5LPM6_9EURO|nr:uncharacterized protein P175DRAFT_0464987 [Aspergillus ochraceoroseus IBT 24754]PTU18233.1 hypothetical protein P175DRAFT_0464987 [Aspergillus ochraceoroseus IBT 24754]
MTTELGPGGVPLSTQPSKEIYTTLLEWLKSHGGNLHESVLIDQDDTRGVHVRVKREWKNATGVSSNTHIIQTPITTTMSYFNAIDYHSSDSIKFPAHGVQFPSAFIESVGPEEVAIFFLIGQYLRGEQGFWYPYLRTLPQPGLLTTPLYYESAEDLEWLQGTSLLAAREQKMGLLRGKYEQSSAELRKAGFGDVEKYTWDLYLWASTIFVSRAFSAKVLSGVITDLGVPEENISVLLPFIDMLNHRPLAKVEWRAGRENVNFVVLEDVGADQEIANNYGPRNNEQLMMNYGFCLAGNPCDYRTLSLRAPPGSPLQIAKAQQAQMFPDLAKDAEDPYYVFNVFYPLLAPDIPMEHSIFSPALFNAVSVLAANNRELETLEITESEIRIPGAYGSSRSLLAAISQIVIELITHIVKLRSSVPGQKAPSNLKQSHAQIYRESQITLSETALVIAAWTMHCARQHGFQGSWKESKWLLGAHMAKIPAGKFPEELKSRIQVRILERPSLLTSSGELFTLSELLHLIPAEMQKSCQDCFKAVLTAAERGIPPLRGMTDEESPFRFPLFLCFIAAFHNAGEGSSLPSRLSRWAGFLLEHYPPPPDDVAWALEDEDDEGLLSMLDDVLENMRGQNAEVFSNLEPFTGEWRQDAWWLSPNWLRWAWMVIEQECVQVPENPLGLLETGGTAGRVMLSTETYLYIPQEQ